MLPQLGLGLLLLCLCVGTPAHAAEIKGKVGLSVDGLNVVSLRPSAVTELLLRSGGGGGVTRRTFADKEGWFTLADVAPGSYVLSTFNPMFVYPEVYVDVTAKSGLARASYVFNKQQIMVKPFVVRPAVQAQYFEPRKPLDVWSIIKSPYGLLIGFMLFGMLVMPLMRVDPEEYKEAMAQFGVAGGSSSEGGSQQRIRDR